MHPMDPRYRPGTPVLHGGAKATVVEVVARLSDGLLVAVETEHGQTLTTMAHLLQIDWDEVLGHLKAISSWFTANAPTALSDAAWLARFVHLPTGGQVLPGQASAFVNVPGSPLEVWQRLEFTSLFCLTGGQSSLNTPALQGPLARRTTLMATDMPPVIRAVSAIVPPKVTLKRMDGPDDFFVGPSGEHRRVADLVSSTLLFANGISAAFVGTRPR
jgi:hypothetical protein